MPKRRLPGLQTVPNSHGHLGQSLIPMSIKRAVRKLVHVHYYTASQLRDDMEDEWRKEDRFGRRQHRPSEAGYSLDAIAFRVANGRE
ncbi:hypothetical protein TNCT_43041 [Trichonephila clavata]|uniref:Uncharacterized protein n=1 Tax=Trichonephila clavata TaxID=2740835 RepID=A0A8X6GRG0_TRICU|nr:hypothetical protein TNCT_43041 [Trichonephila clavata]